MSASCWFSKNRKTISTSKNNFNFAATESGKHLSTPKLLLREKITIPSLPHYSTFCLQKDDPFKEIQKKMAGTWELEKRITWVPMPPVVPGNVDIIVFKEDGSFERKKHDTLLFSGSYFLQQKKDCYPRNSQTVMITNEPGNSLNPYIEIDAFGKLVFSTPNCYTDGGDVVYRRLQ